ncbi:sodium:solute symporter family protein [Arthrobacter echini]|uniref:Sodium:solute symporter family protein n=1 Tax=Arthrobacter echini TaxID=1529066 RepID=A0A4S5E301_9MICC|nr:sodium:solute symporter family protein [Arthrobacter echini]THJ65786.1 sodium:solute symporter family protein [Arthrobacter echini]
MQWYIGAMALYAAFLIWTNVKSLKMAESASDFTAGGHRMGLLLGTGTTTATWVSVASVLGIPAFLYSDGAAAIIGWMAGWIFGGALIPIVGYKIRRPANPARTFPEFVRMRYDMFARRSFLQALIGVVMFIGYLFLVNIQATGFGIVFSSITGVDYKVAIFGFLIFIVITNVGGFWSVATTDTLNAAVIAIGCIAAAVTVLLSTGGLGNILDTLAVTTAPINEGGPALDPGVLLTPTGSFGSAALLSIFISNSLGTPSSPHWVARMLAPMNVKVAVLQIMANVVVLLVIWLPLIVMGLGAKALIPSLPEGVATDYVIPLLLQEHTPVLVAALTLVAICAAAVSTGNSMLLTCSTSLYYDVYLNLFGRTVSDRALKNWLRFIVFVVAVIAVVLAIDPLWFLAMGFTYVYGGFGATFSLTVFLGLYWKRMNRAGAYASIIVGFVAFIIATAADVPVPFVVAVSASAVACLIAVYATKPPPLESYEPFFEAEISESTKVAVERVLKLNPAQQSEAVEVRSV